MRVGEEVIVVGTMTDEEALTIKPGNAPSLGKEATEAGPE